jgi:hypothetical protein
MSFNSAVAHELAVLCAVGLSLLRGALDSGLAGATCKVKQLSWHRVVSLGELHAISRIREFL